MEGTTPSPNYTQENAVTLTATKNEVVLVRIDAQEATNIDLNLSIERNATAMNGHPSCVFLEWTKTGLYDDYSGVGTVEGPGHAVRAGILGQEILNVPGGGNGLRLTLGGGNWSYRDIPVERGESLWFRMSLWSAGDPAFAVSANITADANAVITKLTPPSFTCSGGFVESDTLYAQTAFGPVVTAVLDGETTFRTEHQSEAFVTISRDPRFPASSCRAAIALNGTITAEDEATADWCIVRYVGPAGDYALQYNATGGEAHVFWGIWH